MNEVLAFTGDFLSLGFVVFLGLLILLNFLNLPGNWLCLGCVLAFSLICGASLGTLYWVLAVASAVIGEVLEWVTLAGMIGAIAGAIACAPILMGFGALPGALAGAYLGCLAMELLKGKPWEMAVKAAKGTLMGRFLGALCKCGAGLTIVLLTARALLGNTQV